MRSSVLPRRLQMLDFLHKCLILVGPGDRGRWLLVLALALVASVLEMAGALLVFALLAWVTSGAREVELPVVGNVPAPSADDGALVGLVVAAIAAFFVVRAATILALAYVQHRMAENTGARLAARLLEGYLGMPYTFHLRRNSAELIRNTYDTVQLFVREALLPALKLVGQALTSAGLVVILLYTNLWATLAALAVLGPFSWILLRGIHPRVKGFGRTAQELSKTTLQTLDESLAGWRDIKILGRKRFFVEQFEEDRYGLARARYLRSTAREVPRVAMETGLVLFILGFLGASEIFGGGALEALPVLGLFGYVALRLQPSLNGIMVALNSFKFVGPGIDLLHRDLELLRRDGSRETPGPPPLPLRRELRLDAVSVRYPEAHREAVSDISVTIRAGEFIGIVGPTGGGKSTLVDVVLGFLEPTRGTVFVDGLDLRGHTEAWQAGLGVVHQMVFLADRTLRRNVALGVPDEEIDDALVADAVRLAQLEPFVQSLPEGLNTVVGQRGIRVSGGQRQRLAIARALYRRPSVLVFDEGTSALDNNTESALMTALAGLRGDRTIIVVAHRLTTVAGCERVLLIDDGRLVDVAPFDELAARHADTLLVPR